jgi:TctA family transporter
VVVSVLVSSALITSVVGVAPTAATTAVTWTAQTAAEANAWTSVTYGNGLFVAVSANGTHRVMTSGALIPPPTSTTTTTAAPVAVVVTPSFTG